MFQLFSRQPTWQQPQNKASNTAAIRHPRQTAHGTATNENQTKQKQNKTTRHRQTFDVVGGHAGKAVALMAVLERFSQGRRHGVVERKGVGAAGTTPDPQLAFLQCPAVRACRRRRRGRFQTMVSR